MSFEYYDGSVFECAELNKVDMIVNTVNCKGFMGAGLALEFKLRYPDMFEDYKMKCQNSSLKIGSLDVFNSADLKILNFPTKDDWKKPSNINWIKQGLVYFFNNYKDYQINSIAFPKLGTSNGGLNWEEVKGLMERCFNKIEDLKVFICLDKGTPKGTEGKMVSFLNDLSENELKQLGLKANGIENFIECKPFKRFFQVSKVKGLGIKSYEKLHAYSYKKVLSENIEDNNQQLSLFD